MTNTKVAAALLSGYVLGRTKKAKVAVSTVLWLSGRKYRVKDVAREQVMKFIQSADGEKLADQLRGPALEAAQRAAAAVYEAQVGRLTDTIQQRTLQLTGKAAEGAGEAAGHAEAAGQAAGKAASGTAAAGKAAAGTLSDQGKDSGSEDAPAEAQTAEAAAPEESPRSQDDDAAPSADESAEATDPSQTRRPQGRSPGPRGGGGRSAGRTSDEAGARSSGPAFSRPSGRRS